MLIIEIVIVNRASPAALKKFGRVNEIGQIRTVHINKKRLLMMLILIASSERLYSDDKNGVVT